MKTVFSFTLQRSTVGRLLCRHNRIETIAKKKKQQRQQHDCLNVWALKIITHKHIENDSFVLAWNPQVTIHLWRTFFMLIEMCFHQTISYYWSLFKRWQCLPSSDSWRQIFRWKYMTYCESTDDIIVSRNLPSAIFLTVSTVIFQIMINKIKLIFWF